jgi:hypothetical protein
MNKKSFLVVTIEAIIGINLFIEKINKFKSVKQLVECIEVKNI